MSCFLLRMRSSISLTSSNVGPRRMVSSVSTYTPRQRHSTRMTAAIDSGNGSSNGNSSKTPKERFLAAAGSMMYKLPLRMSAALLSNNIVSGRVAMLGFAYALIGEVLDGKGLLAQIGYDTSVEHNGMDGFFLFVVSWYLASACLPPTVLVTAEESEVASGPRRTASLTQMQRFEGYIGRIAKVGLGCSIIGEALTGKGPLAQLELPHRGIAVCAFLLLMYAATAETGRQGEAESEEE